MRWQLLLLSLALVPVGMARWREQHDAIVRRARKAMKCSLGGSYISQKEAADLIGLSEPNLSRDLNAGGWLAQVMVLAQKDPAFRRQARAQLNLMFDEMEEAACASGPDKSSAA